MPITKAFAFLIPPGKGSGSVSAISSKEIAIGTNKLSVMLSDIFVDDPGPHDFAITFNHAPNGTQVNECRNLVLAFQTGPSVKTGLPIARRLQSVTDKRSGTGLFFLIVGNKGMKQRVVMSRFPTDQAIRADTSSGSLDVEFLEEVFIKRLSSYKAALFEHPSPASGFWTGTATDRQAGQSGEHISEYWLKEFLNADFSETPEQGTGRLATALKDALKTNPSASVKSEIAHASSLASAVFRGKVMSIADFCKHFGFSNAAQDAVKAALKKPSLFGKKFTFDAARFKTVAPYRTVEMNTGAILTAPNDQFENIFQQTSTDGMVEYKTRGKISDQRLAKK
ncbi:MAG: hypothetical protein RSE16_06900 [Sphingobium sp.]|nr:MAG: hypothetical protein RSE16_06900 [Sphingobium sp.]